MASMETTRRGYTAEQEALLAERGIKKSGIWYARDGKSVSKAEIDSELGIVRVSADSVKKVPAGQPARRNASADSNKTLSERVSNLSKSVDRLTTAVNALIRIKKTEDQRRYILRQEAALRESTSVNTTSERSMRRSGKGSLLLGGALLPLMVPLISSLASKFDEFKKFITSGQNILNAVAAGWIRGVSSIRSSISKIFSGISGMAKGIEAKLSKISGFVERNIKKVENFGKKLAIGVVEHYKKFVSMIGPKISEAMTNIDRFVKSGIQSISKFVSAGVKRARSLIFGKPEDPTAETKDPVSKTKPRYTPEQEKTLEERGIKKSGIWYKDASGKSVSAKKIDEVLDEQSKLDSIAAEAKALAAAAAREKRLGAVVKLTSKLKKTVATLKNFLQVVRESKVSRGVTRALSMIASIGSKALGRVISLVPKLLNVLIIVLPAVITAIEAGMHGDSWQVILKKVSEVLGAMVVGLFLGGIAAVAAKAAVAVVIGALEAALTLLTGGLGAPLAIAMGFVLNLLLGSAITSALEVVTNFILGNIGKQIGDKFYGFLMGTTTGAEIIDLVKSAAGYIGEALNLGEKAYSVAKRATGEAVSAVETGYKDVKGDLKSAYSYVFPATSRTNASMISSYNKTLTSSRSTVTSASASQRSSSTGAKETVKSTVSTSSQPAKPTTSVSVIPVQSKLPPVASSPSPSKSHSRSDMSTVVNSSLAYGL